MKTRYKFTGSFIDLRGKKVLVWQSVTRMPNDLRVEQIMCHAEWFWSGGKVNGK